MTSARISPSFKNIAAGLAGLLLALSCFFAAAPQAHAAALSNSQISAILNLLTVFAVDSSTVSDVEAILRGGTLSASTTSTEPDSDDTDSDAPGTITPASIVPTLPSSLPSAVKSLFGSASFSAIPSYGVQPLLVSFFGTVNSAGYSIDFGDGSTSGDIGCAHGSCPASPSKSSINISHSYASAGTYTAKLRQHFTSAQGICTGEDCNVVAIKTITVVATPANLFWNFQSSNMPSASSLVGAVAEVPLVATADSLNLIAGQVQEINNALVDVASAYLALFALDVAPQAAAATTADVSAAGESLTMTLAYLPQSLYETVGDATDFMAAVEMAPVYVITDALSESLFKAGLY